MEVNMMKKYTAYIGTYTTGESKGIYKLTLDSTSGDIEDVKLVAELDNPTYLAIDKTSKYLYSTIKKGDEGGVAAFSIHPSTGNLTMINHQLSSGSAPCHVNLDDNNKYLFSANYHKGLLEAFPLREDGGIETVCSSILQTGSGPNKDRQEKAHTHYVTLTPDQKYLCATDLGTDELVVSILENGNLIKVHELSLHLKPGSGPRHIAFHPNKKHAYILTELSSEVIALEYSETDSKFKILQYIDALPKDFTGESIGSAIHISPDGKYLYTSNRGHDSIAIFKISPSGILELISHMPTGGNHPRDFEITPDGNFILAANMNSNNILCFSVDKSSGLLSKQGSEVTIPNPVCIKFLNI
jgi:6-phosphogluconolactonase